MTCGSTLENDECGVCGGDNSSCADCAGTPNGDASEDNCGTCDDDPSNDCDMDCSGVWGGNAEEDECGICSGDNSSCADCAGTPNGDASEDNCGTCDSDSSNDCVQDCAGTWGGSAEEDECDVCDDSPSNDCTQDCNGDWGGSAEQDECGICGGDGSTCSEIILSLSFDDNVATVNYISNYPIAGFQFTIQGASILNLIDGGDSESNGLTLSIGEYIVIGFSVAANTIPAGEGSLLSFSTTEPFSPLLISNIVFVDSNVNPFSTCFNPGSGCVPIEYESILGCQIPIACNFNPDATVSTYCTYPCNSKHVLHLS